MLRFALICLGSAFGGGVRYLISLWAPRAFGTAFPYGTFIVNVTGSFLIGLIMYVGLNTRMISPDVRFLLTTGVMGGLTTYSTFNYETLNYFQQRAWLVGAGNIAATLIACLVAGLLGHLCGQWIAGH